MNRQKGLMTMKMTVMVLAAALEPVLGRICK